MKHRYPYLSLLILGLASPVQALDCAREDIDHYLDRGFSPEQVVALCGSQAADPAGPEAGGRADLDFLRQAIDGFAITLDAQALSFSRNICVAYDRPNYAEQRKKACGKAHYRIGLQGLTVLDSQSKLMFWGRNAVRVRSPELEQRYELGQETLSERDRRKLEEALNRGQDAEIPVRDGVSPGALQARLQHLAR